MKIAREQGLMPFLTTANTDACRFLFFSFATHNNRERGDYSCKNLQTGTAERHSMKMAREQGRMPILTTANTDACRFLSASDLQIMCIRGPQRLAVSDDDSHV